MHIERNGSERLTPENALQQYLREISPTKKPAMQKAEAIKAQQLIQRLGKHSLAALSSEELASYRDTRLDSLTNLGQPTSNNTVRLELALLSHLFTVATQEWGPSLIFNPMLNIRKPSFGKVRIVADLESLQSMRLKIGRSSTLFGNSVHCQDQDFFDFFCT